MTEVWRPARWRGLLACLFLLAFGRAAAHEVSVDESGLSVPEAAASQTVVSEALQRLPPSMRASVAGVTIQWRSDLPPRVHGRSRGSRVLLDRALLQALPGTGRAPTDSSRPAVAALIHELAHVHDRAARAAISRDPRFLDIAGWQVSPARLGLRRPANAFTDRTPDRYELVRPAEFFAVNLEHFLLDPSYACRRPAMHRYLSSHFHWTPPRQPCTAEQTFVLTPGLQSGAAGDADPLMTIDPARVYAVHYLLAESNDQPMSRWGHSMLRLVVCAPGRVPGPECMLDLQHHRVLSFRAFVDDLQLSSWRGLTGAYASRLFVLPLQQVLDEYTRVELRGLQSIPLQFEPDEVSALVERAAQLHWSYDGRYAFVSNNCAVETYRLLHDAVPRLAASDLGSITPNGLARRLQRSRVADASVLDDPVEALRLGYRFDAMSDRYQAMLEVARAGLDLPPMRVSEWLELAPAQRARWIGAADLRASAALLVLEQAALRRQELLARDELKRQFSAAQRRSSLPVDARAALGNVLELEDVLSRPALLVPGGGYGLPQQPEREALATAASSRQALMARQKDGLQAQARQALSPARRDALDGSKANLQALGEHLRRLHREQGGVQLN